MSEQVFKSPGFFEREIEVQSKPPKKEPNSSPVGIIGAAEKGPAFVPIILNSMDDYTKVFGDVQKDKLAGHAVSEFFTVKQGGTGAIQYIRTLGNSDKSGFTIDMQLLCSSHTICLDENKISNNFTGADELASSGKLLRAIFMLHKDCNLSIDYDNNKLKLNAGSTGIKERSVTVSFDQNDNNYLDKVLNTDPFKLEEYGYYLYAHFPIQSIYATTTLSDSELIGVDELGDFSKKFTSPKSPKFISQPFGSKEYDLFEIETIDDGIYSAGKYKISISNLRASTDVDYKFGTFNLEVRDLNDTDDSPLIYESYTNCSLDPSSSNYIAKLIGNKKVKFDDSIVTEKRLITSGEYDNQSNRIRIIVSEDVKNGIIPSESLPFGFKGIPSLFKLVTSSGNEDYVSPPLPFRFKVTKGKFDTEANIGVKGQYENVDVNKYWGIINFNIDSLDTPNNRATTGMQTNSLVENLCKFMGNNVTTDENSKDSDDFNSNKFTLARVVFNQTTVDDISDLVSESFGSAVYWRGGQYDPVTYKIDIAVNDSRVSMASVLSENKEKFNKFSAFSKFTAPLFGGFDGLNIFDKDSVNMNDRSCSAETDGKAIGYDSGLSNTSDASLQGEKLSNNIISAYIDAVNIMLEPATAYVHVILLPGIREKLITNYVALKTAEFGKAIYLMDIPHYDSDGGRLFGDKSLADKKADISNTISKLNARNFDNNYVATYFPDVLFDDASDKIVGLSKRVINLPSSIIAMSALAKSEGSRTIQPWFAPAGFGNGANPRIKGVTVRLKADDRDDLYENKINPIATFPTNQYVIFGQKTLQVSNTSLSRVNVRRLMIEVKRGVERAAQALLFEPNNQKTRDNFSNTVNAFLSNIKLNSGIENYRIVISNDPNEIDQNILSGKIIIVPTRVVEFIAMDFVVTNSGVTFA